MPEFVLPRVYLVGYTSVDESELKRYLEDTGNTPFLEEYYRAVAAGLHPGECICSFYAKLCYSSLSEGKNKNLSRVRGIDGNLASCLDHGHTAVFEHCWLNFAIHDCSRVYTHELVRHRAGTAFSQTSGRYVRTDKLCIVTDPLLDQHSILSTDEQSEAALRMEQMMLATSARIDAKKPDQVLRKKLTSAVRRFLPNGQANEMGVSFNLTALRHVVQARTSRHAEWEMRLVMQGVYCCVKAKFPTVFCDAVEEEVDGLVEVTGMRTKPYGGV